MPRPDEVIQRISCTAMKPTALTLILSAMLAGSSWSQDTNADNTGKNKRDKDDQSVTATDQSNDPADLKITADIRKMVVGDDSLSMMGKNVKIVTMGGVVTLRGPVETEKEKATIESHAKQAGAKKITNQLEIKKS
jgi:hyperosmotically inducible periplasmic protein